MLLGRFLAETPSIDPSQQSPLALLLNYCAAARGVELHMRPWRSAPTRNTLKTRR